MCPVTASIFLKVVAETALRDLESGRSLDAFAPFRRIVSREPKIAARISCGSDGVEHNARLNAAAASDSR
jgi:hypothetical protein